MMLMLYNVIGQQFLSFYTGHRYTEMSVFFVVSLVSIGESTWISWNNYDRLLKFITFIIISPLYGMWP